MEEAQARGREAAWDKLMASEDPIVAAKEFARTERVMLELVSDERARAFSRGALETFTSYGRGTR